MQPFRSGLVCTAVGEQADAPKNPPRTVGEVLDALRENGPFQAVARLRDLFGRKSLCDGERTTVPKIVPRHRGTRR